MGESTAIYYFSATGNSLAVALSLTQKLGCSEPISIPGTLLMDDPYEQARTAKRVGFVFPVQRATLPEMVLGFIKAMPKRHDCYYFAVATYTIFGCNEFWDIEEALEANGCLLNYAVGIKTMGNVGPWTPDSKKMTKRLEAIEVQVGEIADAVGNFQENSFKRSSKLLGSIVSKFTTMRRKSLSLKVNNKCNKCGICVQVCPANNIIVGKDGAVAPVRSDVCQACYACLHWCPANAIATRRMLHTHYHHPGIRPDQLNHHTKEH